MAKTNIVDWKTITDFVVDAFVGYRIPKEDAEICADVLLESDKSGIEYVKKLGVDGIISQEQVLLNLQENLEYLLHSVSLLLTHIQLKQQ